MGWRDFVITIYRPLQHFRFIKPRRMFVELPQYELDIGKADPSDIVVEELDGVPTKGVYVLAPGEKAGYHHVEDYQDRKIQQRTTINDGTVELQEGDLDAQWAHMGAQFNAQEKKHATTKELTNPLEAILARLGHGVAPEDETQASGAKDSDDSGNSQDESPEASEASVDEMDGTNAVDALFGVVTRKKALLYLLCVKCLVVVCFCMAWKVFLLCPSVSQRLNPLLWVQNFFGFILAFQ